MTPDYMQSKSFADSVMPRDGFDGLLESAIAWIKNNLEPEDVFSESDLESWAATHGYVSDEDEGE